MFHSRFQIRPPKPYPIPDQNKQRVYPFSDQNGTKTLPNGVAHTYIAYVRDFPSPHGVSHYQAVILQWGEGLQIHVIGSWG